MKVSLLGTGIIGYPMAERLLQAGHQVTVFNRTRAKAEPLAAWGAEIAPTAAQAVRAGQCVILVLSDAAAINALLFDREGVEFEGRTFIQMGTIAPPESIALKEKIAARGGDYLECPVLGSKAEAQSGKLILMVGATQAEFKAWENLLRTFGPSVRRAGEVGTAAALKLALNQLIASLIAAISLSIGMAQKNGVSVDLFMDILRESALYAPMFDKKAPAMLRRDFASPNFPLKHLLKDVDLFLKEAKGIGLTAWHLEGIRALIEKGVSAGLGEEDYSAVFNVINPAGAPKTT